MEVIKNHETIYDRLKHFHSTKRIPHIIFYGESGSGKMTIAFNFIKTIYSNDEKSICSNVMFVNCAHGKGIKFIREEIKFFAKTNSQASIHFKTVVLLNADHLTIDAQSALRRCIEQFSLNTRFFIIIENKYRLMMPILSRFCEIYVPCAYDEKTNRMINLHQKTLDETFPYRKEYDMRQKSRVNEILKPFVDKPFDYQDIMKTVSTLYESALCAKDIIEWVSNSEEWTNYEKTNIGMCYQKVKSEFRCEKLLMMFVLSIVLYTPDVDIKDLSFM